MSTGAEIFVTILMIALGIVAVQVFLSRLRQKEKKVYPEIWSQFHASVKMGLNEEILCLGNELIHNSSLTQKDLTDIHDIAIELSKKDARLENLRLNAYNKQLYFNRLFSKTFDS